MDLKGNTITVPIDSVAENSWNPNRMSDEQFAAVGAGMERHGQVAPVVARKLDDGTYEIIDGAHRFRHARESGSEQILLHDLGTVDDETAKRLTIMFGRTRGEFDPFAYGELLKSLRDDGVEFDSLSEIADDEKTLESLADALDYDWEFEVDQTPKGQTTTFVFIVPVEHKNSIMATLDRYPGDRSEQFLQLVEAAAGTEPPAPPEADAERL